jgi:putative SOS response-associated peptidase YedK
MCGRYTIGSSTPGEFDARFGGQVDVAALHRYNVAPTQAVPVVSGGPDLGERTTGEAHWGLLAPWASTRKEKLKPINARAESLAEKKLFAPLLADASHRVLVLADGWYEWLRPEDPKGARVPFHHVVDGGGPFAFAGLARTVKVREEEGGERIALRTMAIVTCAANGPAGRIHDRMPAVLGGAEEEAAWLSPAVDAREAATLLRPLEDGRVTVRPANPLVNSVRSADGPWLLDPHAAPDAQGAGAPAGGDVAPGAQPSGRDAGPAPDAGGQTALPLEDPGA